MNTVSESHTGRSDDAFVWVEVIEDALHCVPAELRLKVLQALVEKETERRKKPLQVKCISELMLCDLANFGAVKKATSLVVQVLTRSITNNSSPEDAAKILFRHHRMGTGSGWLPDYLDRVPGIKVDRKRCAAIASEA